jgi:hypothetical protein
MIQVVLDVRIQNHFVAICTTRSLTVDIPRGRLRPSGFGIITRLSGLGS